MADNFIPDVAGNRWYPGNLGRDAALVALAARQEGLIAQRQLRGLGLEARAIRRRIDSGRLFPHRNGVFSVGHARLTEAGPLLAALLAYPPGARIAHRSAAEWWRLLKGRSARIDVITETGRARLGTRLHRGTLSAGEGGVCRGVPVTSVGRTLADLATSVHPKVVEAALHEAQVLRLLSGREIAVAVRSSERRRSGRRLRALLEEIDPEVVFRSHLERRFYARLKESGAPLPQTNYAVELGSRLVSFDAAWPEHRYAVELDSTVHDTPTRRRADAARDADAWAAGWRVERLRDTDLADFFPDLAGKRPDPG